MSESGQGDILSGVGITALGAAAARAVESSRPDRLMDDPFAAAFVAAARAPVPLLTRWPAEGTELSDQEIMLLYGSVYVGLRSRLCDDHLREAAAAGVRQFVVLAAGLDARGFRLDWPAGTRLFEIDQPKVLDFKETVLRERGAVARCDRVTVAADFREDWAAALTGAGFTASAPSFWLAEGLLPYLPAAVERALFTRLDELSAPGSRLVAEWAANLTAFAADGEEGRRLREWSERTGIPMDQLIATEARPDPADELTERGWIVTEEPVAAAAERYGRDIADPGLPHLRTPPSAPAGLTVGGAAETIRTSFLAARRPD